MADTRHPRHRASTSSTALSGADYAWSPSSTPPAPAPMEGQTQRIYLTHGQWDGRQCECTPPGPSTSSTALFGADFAGVSVIRATSTCTNGRSDNQHLDQWEVRHGEYTQHSANGTSDAENINDTWPSGGQTLDTCTNGGSDTENILNTRPMGRQTQRIYMTRGQQDGRHSTPALMGCLDTENILDKWPMGGETLDTWTNGMW
jgi:hypothetical protein